MADNVSPSSSVPPTHTVSVPENAETEKMPRVIQNAIRTDHLGRKGIEDSLPQKRYTYIIRRVLP